MALLLDGVDNGLVSNFDDDDVSRNGGGLAARLHDDGPNF